MRGWGAVPVGSSGGGGAGLAGGLAGGLGTGAVSAPGKTSLGRLGFCSGLVSSGFWAFSGSLMRNFCKDSRAFEGRLSIFRSRCHMTQSQSQAGRSGRSRETGVTRWSRCEAITSGAVSPSKGRRPVRAK